MDGLPPVSGPQGMPSSGQPSSPYNFAALSWEVSALSVQTNDPYGQSPRIQSLLNEMSANVPPGMQQTFNLFKSSLQKEGNGSQDCINSGMQILNSVAPALNSLAIAYCCANRILEDIQRGVPKEGMALDENSLSEVTQSLVQYSALTPSMPDLLHTFNQIASGNIPPQSLYDQLTAVLSDLGVQNPAAFISVL